VCRDPLGKTLKLGVSAGRGLCRLKSKNECLNNANGARTLGIAEIHAGPLLDVLESLD
jgi:hypothetical protein